MIFVDLMGLKLLDICLTGEENPKKISPRKRLDRVSNPGPLRDRRACYSLLHNGRLPYFQRINFNLLYFDFEV